MIKNKNSDSIFLQN